jgi:hypothetical protein
MKGHYGRCLSGRQTLLALMELDDAVKAKTAGAFPDRRLWITMKRVVNMETEKVTFRMNFTLEDWLKWVIDEVTPEVLVGKTGDKAKAGSTAGSKGDTFFQGMI